MRHLIDEKSRNSWKCKEWQLSVFRGAGGHLTGDRRCLVIAEWCVFDICETAFCFEYFERWVAVQHFYLGSEVKWRLTSSDISLSAGTSFCHKISCCICLHLFYPLSLSKPDLPSASLYYYTIRSAVQSKHLKGQSDTPVGNVTSFNPRRSVGSLCW